MTGRLVAFALNYVFLNSFLLLLTGTRLVFPVTRLSIFTALVKKMRIYTQQLLLLGATSSVEAWLTIPWVSSVVESMTTQLSSMGYNGRFEGIQNNPGSSSQQVLEDTQPPGPPEGPPRDPRKPKSPPPADPYWFEHIGHQGLASFSSKPGSYQVYRNVKDFGAKGTPPTALLTQIG